MSESGPQWLDLDTAAERSGRSVGHLARRCRAEWLAAGLARLDPPAGGGKPEWHVREDADAALARVKFPEQLPANLGHLSEKKRKIAFQRLDLLKRWEQALAGRHQLGFTEAKITQQFIATAEAIDGKPLSRATLYLWRSKYRRSGLSALADQRGLPSVPSPGTPGEGKGGGDFFDLVRRLWLHLNKPSLASCYQIACYEAQRSGWPAPPSYGHVHRLIKQVPLPVVDKFRNGEKAFTDNSAVFVERDYAALHTNESWCGDHHQFDVICQAGGASGELLRPWLTAWMDERSRKLVGWRIFPHAPNSDTILLSLKDGMEPCGVPREVYVDNGKDYDCYALNGRTKADRWRKTRFRLDYDAPYLGGLFAELGIDVTHCQPWHGQSKLIERWFGTMEGQFGKTFATYCGRCPQEKPTGERAAGGVPRGLQLNLEQGKAPTLAAFVEAFAAYVATYHAAVHTGNGMDGRTPDQVFAAEWRDHAKRIASGDLLWWLTLKPQHPTKVTQLGVRCNGIHYGSLEPRLFEYRGREVLVRHDPARVNEVFVCAMDGRPICIAAANRRLPANASSQELKEALSQMRQDHKRVKEYVSARPTIAHDPTDRLILARAAANANRSAENPQPAPEPPALQPVRAPFESEITHLRTAMERQPARLAVGAESLSFGQLGDTLAAAQRADEPQPDADPFARLSEALAQEPDA